MNITLLLCLLHALCLQQCHARLSDPFVSYSSISPLISPRNALPSSTPLSCNGHPDFCSRSYGNISFVGTHNSPFNLPSSPFSNQHQPILTQLSAGIRLLQAQVHLYNHILTLCHTSCDYLNAGPAEDFFKTIADWMNANPGEVVTILLGNFDLVPASAFRAPLESSGLAHYAFHPLKSPMTLVDWPTLGELISGNQRAVIFIDASADQATVPYLLDEFSQLWETVFDPVDRNFPCTVDRPPGLGQRDAKNTLYAANHNLNSPLVISGKQVLVPDVRDLEATNGISGVGSLGLAVDNCAATWGRPPNFLLVDFYDVGNGSVFQVGAKANGAEYVPSPTMGDVISTTIGSNVAGTMTIAGPGATTGALGSVVTIPGVVAPSATFSNSASKGGSASRTTSCICVLLLASLWVL